MRESFVEAVHSAFDLLAQSPPRVMVVGDVMLDRYIWGDVERVSPEAPVAIVRVTNRSERLGGSANVAANLAGLGVEVALVGHVGNDADASRLKDLVEEAGVMPVLIRSDDRPTITKTRILGGHQQMLRLDEEDTRSQPHTADQALITAAYKLFETWEPELLILSDYAKGALSNEVCQSLILAAARHQIPALVDPKGQDYSKYYGATALTPNQKETAEACQCDVNDIDTILRHAETLRNKLALDFLVMTRSENGMALLETGQILHLDATAKQVFDVSGAGDTVIAALAVALLGGLTRADSCKLANLAAGIVVGQVGTAIVRREELVREVESQSKPCQSDKVCDENILIERVKLWRDRGEKVVFTNGCFDILHAGHVSYLEQARALGDRLVLGLNSDLSVRNLKGASRPIVKEQDRARVLAALESIDAIVLFDQPTPEHLISRLSPDFLVKGGDYSSDDVIGGRCVTDAGGVVKIIEFFEGHSTTKIIEKIRL